jgi:hypothetical protein
MVTVTARASINTTARRAGALYLALVPFSAFSFFYVPSVLVVRDDAATTARNIMASELLFRAGTVSHLITQVIFVGVVLALYRLFKPVSESRATLMVVLALLGIPIACVNEVNHLAILRLLSGASDGALSSTQLHAQVMLFLNMYDDGIFIAQAFWGLWLLPLSSLVLRSGFLPKVLGIAVLVAGAAYVFDSSTQLLALSSATISQYTFVAELLFPLWLVVKGVNVERWQVAAA